MSNIGIENSTLAPSPSQRVTMKQIWKTLKNYFGDGYVIHSSPFRFNVHLCETQELRPENDNIFFGVNIDENMIPLFGCFGETVKPPCTCDDIVAVRQYIDDFVEKNSSIDDSYKIFTMKDEGSVEETCAYAMRDTLQFWIQWHDGSLARGDYWKHLYIAFAVVCDDVLVPPDHFLDGTFRFLGHTAIDIFAGMLSEGVSVEGVQYLEMCILRECFAQYIEKTDPKIRELLLEKTHVMSKFHIVTANAHGCAAALLAARGVAFDGLRDEAVEMAAYGDCLSMNVMKEAFGFMHAEATDPTAGRDRDRLQAEMRWMYARTMNQLNTHERAKYLKKYATAGLHFVSLNERYQERVGGGRRRTLTPQMQALIASYTVGPSGPVCVEAA